MLSRFSTKLKNLFYQFYNWSVNHGKAIASISSLLSVILALTGLVASFYAINLSRSINDSSIKRDSLRDYRSEILYKEQLAINSANLAIDPKSISYNKEEDKTYLELTIKNYGNRLAKKIKVLSATWLYGKSELQYSGDDGNASITLERDFSYEHMISINGKFPCFLMVIKFCYEDSNIPGEIVEFQYIKSTPERGAEMVGTSDKFFLQEMVRKASQSKHFEYYSNLIDTSYNYGQTEINNYPKSNGIYEFSYSQNIFDSQRDAEVFADSLSMAWNESMKEDHTIINVQRVNHKWDFSDKVPFPVEIKQTQQVIGSKIIVIARNPISNDILMYLIGNTKGRGAAIWATNIKLTESALQATCDHRFSFKDISKEDYVSALTTLLNLEQMARSIRIEPAIDTLK